ncbi:MAG: HK97 gp10 family phage protein [Gemmatimonadaceae bacterium]|nr:HK97 gp10 family phage protein [Gemmatimonadaceae bacterium]
MATTSVIVRSRVPQVIAKVHASAAIAVAKAALDVEAQAKNRAPVDTGFLKNSIHASKEQETVWRVDSPADYSLYVELGTRRMAPQPYLIPALEFVRPSLEAALRRLV